MIPRKPCHGPSLSPLSGKRGLGFLNNKNTSFRNQNLHHKNVFQSQYYKKTMPRLYSKKINVDEFTEEEFEKHNAARFPKEDQPQEVNYSGPETLRVAYVMDRIPIISREEHPIEMAWNDHSTELRQEKSRHKYRDFWQFYENWKPVYEHQQKEENKSKKKKKKKKQDEGKKIRGPDKWIKIQDPEPSELSKHRWINKSGEKQKEERRFAQTFRPPPRYTISDFEDVRSTFLRQLHRRLFFIVLNPETGKWQFPSTVRTNPLTMRQAVENLHREHFGWDLYAYFLSNAPIGHWVNPEDSNDMTFFYHCLYVTGEIPEENWDDWALVTRHELQEYDMEDGYHSVIKRMLPEGFESVGT
eukprot:gb/GECH01013840.1/.p1 GENE.gb/GECH01013840.1/~~gb/GECH01013840.1/.p1  ORF type:complete len:357 (+),score=96.21 gb/GECH01013840.1/:1-1071(+)